MKNSLKILTLAALTTMYSCKVYYYENKHGQTIEAELTTGVSVPTNGTFVHRDSSMKIYNPNTKLTIALVNEYHNPKKYGYGVELIGVKQDNKLSYDWLYTGSDSTEFSNKINETWRLISNELKTKELEKKRKFKNIQTEERENIFSEIEKLLPQ
ncbi:MAG: hypothetical protein ACP5N1_01815 [Candidatus Woesearchaeota archaeon]